VESLVNFWKNKKVLITGHTGFKGNWLALWLVKLGARVTGYSLPAPTNPNMFEICKTEEKMHKHIIADINNLTDLKTAIEDNEIIFHFAAQAIVRESYEQPTYTFQTNIMGTANILEACRNSKYVKSIIICTSDKCYKNKEWKWGYRENDELGGYDPYSASKASSELVADAYRSSFNLPVATVRSGNVIGGGDFAKDRIIPDCIRYSNMCQTLRIRYPSATRPFQFVLEPLKGYLLLAETLYINEFPDNYRRSFNFGANESKSVLELIDAIKSFIPLEVDLGYPEKHEASSLVLNSDLAKDLLNWYPKWSLNESLFKTIDWYNAYSENQDMFDFTMKQIGAYEL
jgi:CDP-glucose 4,6-dehydratase